VDDDLGPVRALLSGARLTAVAELGSGERTRVRRVGAEWPDSRRQRLIVKEYFTAGEGWVRETAALSVLAGVGGRLRLVAAAAAPPIIVTEDLGPGGSVADALLGDDPDPARAAVVGWAEALAALHVATRDSRPAFRAALAEREGELPVNDAPLAAALEDTVRILDRECGALGVRVPGDAFADLRGLVRRLGDTGAVALSPSDTCPDNNVVTADGVVLLDYEDAQWRAVAWDVAYLRVPWPTCWCSWRMPAALADEAVAAYRRAAGAAFPAVAADTFAADVDAAALGWALVSTSLFLDNALGSDPPLNDRRPTPTRRAMILHRLDRASASTAWPAPAELAGRLAAELRRRWGDVPLAYARAFRRAQ
jgi:hypothetical protein